MDYKKNKKILIEKRIDDKEEKKKINNSYLQRLLQNKNKSPKSKVINLTSYNENLPSFKISIRDILSTEENKQKAINYVIQKRNEEKYGIKSQFQRNNVINNKEENKFQSNRHNNNYNSNSNMLNKNKTFYNNSNSNILTQNHNGLITNRTNNYLQIKNQSESNESSVTDKNPTYSYYYPRRNKQNAPQIENNNNHEDNHTNNILNKNGNLIQPNNNIKNKTANLSPYTNRTNFDKFNDNIINANNNMYKKVNRNLLTKKRDKSQNYDIRGNITENYKYKPLMTFRKNENDNLMNNNEMYDNSSQKKSYDILPLNRKNNISSFYSKYPISNLKKNFINNNSNNKNNNFKIFKNSIQIISTTNNKDKIKSRYGYKKSKNIKQKIIEVYLYGNKSNINNEITNLKVTKIMNKNQQNNNLIFKDINELIDFINNKYDQEKKLNYLK